MDLLAVGVYVPDAGDVGWEGGFGCFGEGDVRLAESGEGTGEVGVLWMRLFVVLMVVVVGSRVGVGLWFPAVVVVVVVVAGEGVATVWKGGGGTWVGDGVLACDDIAV